MSSNNLCIITGASRGFGRSSTIAILEKFPKINFLLVGRNIKGLEETKTILKKNENYKDNEIKLFSCDFSLKDQLEENITKLFETCDTFGIKKWNRVIFINNHGSLGTMGLCFEEELLNLSVDQLESYTTLNYTSYLILFLRFLKFFNDKEKCENASLVNVSSGAAVRPFQGWTLYCSLKSARNMILKVITSDIEETKQEKPIIRTLNYSPGPLDTDMQGEIRKVESENYFFKQKKMFTNLKEEGKLFSALESSRKMVTLLEKDEWKSGEHIDIRNI